MQYWLLKTEPTTFSINDLEKEKITEWYGIRNYQVRNMLRDDMQIGDHVFIYHSNCKEIGIVGEAKITSQGYPDTKQFEKKSPYFDVKSKKENPTWISRDVTFVKKFKHLLPLADLKKEQKLAGMRSLQRGNRLSITPVSKAEYEYICTLAK